MKESFRDIASIIQEGLPTVAALAMEEFMDSKPELKNHYSARQLQTCRKDFEYITLFFSASIRYNRPEILAEFLGWCKSFFPTIDVPYEEVFGALMAIQKQVIEFSHTSKLAEDIRYIVEEATKMEGQHFAVHLSFIDDQDNPQAFEAREYLNLLLDTRRMEAFDLIYNLINQGIPIKNIYLNIFQPVQYEIGRLWQKGEISVAQEHYCTAATQTLIANLYKYFLRPSGDKTMVAACAPGELHEMGLRMLADIFEMEGWHTVYIGANTPVNDLLKLIEKQKPLILALSATLPFNVAALDEIISRIKKAEISTKILVGGLPFKLSPGLWKDIGADAYAADALSALQLAQDLISKN
ncbi:MAG: MerR family transcriptional regulator, light-induced transcriptional regulator [Bacteroidales bacterium]|jgi:methanogenic corrinoid protein MtbC1|nr:MerR family transcriptional regulator, light-induced transcriptional regulator [Bacteroidales bacterium]MDN5329875.1 MerR family transcriptional regulator, light-induced transcriptional regulator [Bacteroidales bacterium]